MSKPTNAGIVQIGEERWIPGSQRADGSYRKERKIRPGFVPLEDVQRYTNATLSSNKTMPGGKPGTKPGIPGTKQKEAAPAPKKQLASDVPLDKRIKALNKKLRQISELEEKLVKGEKLNEEQMGKINKGKEIRNELATLTKEQDLQKDLERLSLNN
jgi:partner of Y14 and mago protein